MEELLEEEEGSSRCRAWPLTRAQASGMHSTLMMSMSVLAQNSLNSLRTCGRPAWGQSCRVKGAGSEGRGGHGRAILQGGAAAALGAVAACGACGPVPKGALW